MRPIIQLSSGKYFDLLRPELAEFTIHDIAAALSKLCRFTGHTREFYSVAQHSVLVSQEAPEELKMNALLHDAAEFVLGDVASPLKSLLPHYKMLEASVQQAVRNKFNYGFECTHPAVKHLDLVLLATERRDLMPNGDDSEWEILKGIAPLSRHIQPLPPAEAYRLFIGQYNSIATEEDKP